MKILDKNGNWPIMKVLNRGALENCQRIHADIRGRLAAWLAEVQSAKWTSPNDLKARFPSASLLANNRCVFNIGGNRYRLVAQINYEVGVVLVRWCGTHAEYDRIDAETI